MVSAANEYKSILRHAVRYHICSASSDHFNASWLGSHHLRRANHEISLHRLTHLKHIPPIYYFATHYICLADILQEKSVYLRCILYYRQMQLISSDPIG